jgi:hypothetical protein
MAIFNAPFIQERYAFSCVLRHSPAGILAIDADKDLAAIDKRVKYLRHSRRLEICEPLKAVKKPWATANVVATYLNKFS